VSEENEASTNQSLKRLHWKKVEVLEVVEGEELGYSRRWSGAGATSRRGKSLE
jgi:hypothetical protein